MKVSFKTIGKGLVAIGTAAGAAILALQTKKSVSEEVEAYDNTLEPLGTDTTPAEEKPEMEEAPTVEAEVVPEETETKEE